MGSALGAAEAPRAKKRRAAGMRNIIMNTSKRWLALSRGVGVSWLGGGGRREIESRKKGGRLL
jgi:hypothetical protein